MSFPSTLLPVETTWHVSPPVRLPLHWTGRGGIWRSRLACGGLEDLEDLEGLEGLEGLEDLEGLEAPRTCLCPHANTRNQTINEKSNTIHLVWSTNRNVWQVG